jgi:hypothetical protein
MVSQSYPCLTPSAGVDDEWSPVAARRKVPSRPLAEPEQRLFKRGLRVEHILDGVHVE